MAEPAPLLYLARPCLRSIREHAEAAWPHEACGLLEGFASGIHARVRRVVACRNEHERPARRYRIDPEVFLRADRAAERVGRRIVGVWHSHPDGRVHFSDTDRAEAWPGWHYLIVGVTGRGVAGAATWRIDPDGRCPVPGRLRPSAFPASEGGAI